MSSEATQGQPAKPEGVDVAAIMRIAFGQWPWILAISVIATLVVGVWVKLQTPIYRATITIKIDPHAIRPLGREVQTPGDSTDYYWTNKEYYETQYKIMQSRKVAERVARLLNLHKDAGFMTLAAPGETPEEPAKEPTLTDAAQKLLSRLTVEPVEKSRLVAVSLEDSDPARAQRIVNALVEAYIEQNLDASLVNIG